MFSDILGDKFYPKTLALVRNGTSPKSNQVSKILLPVLSLSSMARPPGATTDRAHPRAPPPPRLPLLRHHLPKMAIDPESPPPPPLTIPSSDGPLPSPSSSPPISTHDPRSPIASPLSTKLSTPSPSLKPHVATASLPHPPGVISPSAETPSLFNPVTSDHILLPPLEGISSDDPQLYRGPISAPPADTHCAALVFAHGKILLHRGLTDHNKWIRLNRPELTSDSVLNDVFHCPGKFYYVFEGSTFYVIDPFVPCLRCNCYRWTLFAT